MGMLPTKIFDTYYGQPGTGKSESACRVLEQLYRETGKKARIAVGDGSALTYQHLADAGVAEIWEYTSRSWPLDTMKALTEGQWPEHVNDPESPLLPVGPANLEVGAYVIEGLSVGAGYLMGGSHGGMAWKAAHGIKVGQDSPFHIVEGLLDPKTGQLIPGSGPGTKFGGNSMAHYGVVQNYMRGFIQQSRKLANVVIWTAHEATNDPEKDSLVKEQIIGPEVIGKAMTTTVQRVYTNTLHMQTVAKRVKQDDSFTGKKVDELDLEYRVYTRDHFNANGTLMTRYKGCTRVSDAEFPQFFTSSEPGKAVLDFYEALQERSAQKRRALTI